MSTLTTLCLAVSLAGQAGKTFEKQYDQFKDISILRANLGTVFVAGKDTLELNVFHASKGQTRGPLAPEASITLHFIARCKEWRYLKYRDITILAGGDRYNLGEPAHDGEVDKMANVTEQFFGRLTFAQLQKISRSPSISMQVGTDEFSLAPEQVHILAGLADRLKLDEATAEKGERARNSAVITEWEAAQRESRDLARKGSKGNLQRNYDREMIKRANEICAKHKLTANQLLEIVGVKRGQK